MNGVVKTIKYYAAHKSHHLYLKSRLDSKAPAMIFFLGEGSILRIHHKVLSFVSITSGYLSIKLQVKLQSWHVPNGGR